MPDQKRYVLWGSAGHARVLTDIIDQSNGKVIALFDNNPNALPTVPGIPLYLGKAGFELWLGEQVSTNNIAAAVAIGGARGRDRHELALIISRQGISLPTIVHPSSVISPTAKLGMGCHLLAQTVVAAGTSLGDMCIINHKANVDHECELGHGVHIGPGATLCGCISVGDYSMIGAGAVILPRVRIGKNVVVGAGSVVTKDIPDHQIVAGNPAKPLEAKND